MSVHRRVFVRTALGAAAAIASARAEAAAVAGPGTHRLALQVDTDDHRIQAMVLGNARNYAAHYRETGDAFEIRIVAFGPGYSLVRADASGLAEPLAALRHDLGDALAILACQNTRRALAKGEGKAPGDIPLLPGVAETPSGVVALAELQEVGWAYIRP